MSTKAVFPKASQNLNQKDRFKPEKPNLSYADLHHVITKEVRDLSPKYSGSPQKQKTSRRASEDDELIKYMSNLPSYLVRGENIHEKVLSVGVLDWGRLEKWQYNHKQVPVRSGRNSLSSSTSSSSFSTEGSSAQSSSGNSCSPSSQRVRRPSLQFHLMSSSTETYSHVAKSSGVPVGKFHEVRAVRAKTIKEQGKFVGTNMHLSRSYPDGKLDKCKTKDSDSKVTPDSGTLRSAMKYSMAPCTKVKPKTQNDDFVKRRQNLIEPNLYAVDGDVSGKSDTVVLLLPRDLSQKNLSGVPQVSDSGTILDERPLEAASRRSFSEISNEVYYPQPDTDIPHSCPLPYEFDSSEHTQMKEFSTNADGSNLSYDLSNSGSSSAKEGTSASRRTKEEEKMVSALGNSSATESFKGLNIKASKPAAEKGRSTSPFRRLSMSMSKMGKSFSGKETLAMLQPSLRQMSGRSRSENAAVFSSRDASSSDITNSTSRARSSPLRRLLDPLLKPKTANCRYTAEPSREYPVAADRACKSSNGNSDPSTGTLRSAKAKLEMAGCKTADINCSSENKTCESSTIQAFLQVAIKNGLPLFTFAADSDSDVLAATMKKLKISRKDDEYHCIYTFFTFKEIKKKNARWINQGGKGKGQDYISNVVAQMKVSGSKLSDLAGHYTMDQSSMKEFVLFAVDLKPADHQTSYFQPIDELAAIVVRIPKRINIGPIRNGHQNGACCDLPEIGLKDHLPEARVHSNSGENVQTSSICGCQEPIRATVILPSGVHSIPSKGEPSSLVQRWRSGGSCDCGGWDLGCKLRVFDNWNQLIRKLGSSKASSLADKFELFSQGGVQENQPFFSLTPIKEGIYAVEFNPSLKTLEAFSICIAVLDSRNPYELSESSSLSEGKSSFENLSTQNDGIRAPGLVDGEVPARYVSYPPLSPVGRV